MILRNLFHSRSTDERIDPSPIAADAFALEVVDVHKKFGHTLALAPTSFSIKSGEFVSILGASGSGKSTLLALIMGIAAQDGGRILLFGKSIENLPPEARNVAMVFQSYALFPHMNVRRNIAFGLRMKKISAAEQKRRIDHVVEICKLGTYVDRMPKQLSGGQQQRVALARALVMQPALMLYDEPLSNLDLKLREDVRAELISLHRQTGTTALYVTHDYTDALTMADRVMVMSAGHLIESGTPASLYRHPKYRFTAECFGSRNLIAVSIKDGMAILPWGQVWPIAPHCDWQRDCATALIRPEGITLVAHRDGLGTISAQTFVGTVTQYEVNIASHHVQISAMGNLPLLEIGTRVTLMLSEPLHLLEETPIEETLSHEIDI